MNRYLEGNKLTLNMASTLYSSWDDKRGCTILTATPGMALWRAIEIAHEVLPSSDGPVLLSFNDTEVPVLKDRADITAQLWETLRTIQQAGLP